MDTLNSFKGYGKMDPAADRAFRRKTRKRIIFIAVTAVLLVAILATVATVLAINRRNSHDNNNLFSPQSPVSTSSSIRAICSVTRYPNSCYDSLSAAATINSSAVSADPASLFNLSLAVASRALSYLPSFLSTFDIPSGDKRLQAAVRDCRDLIDDAIDRIHESAALDFGRADAGERKIRDLKTWLSAVIANQETCLDGFEGTSGGFREKLESAMGNSTQFVSNSLAIVARIMGVLGKLHFPINRKLLEVEGGGIFPEWETEMERRMLLEGELEANVTVAKDGSGNVTSVQEAVNMVPRRSSSLFVIRIKAGEYEETVVVDKNKWNVVIIGDGMYKTSITSSKNFIDGTPTFSTATFAVTGRNFMAKDIGFKNTAGAEKHQAVALRSGSDHSIFYRCSFDGFQDTLYAHSNRQFYRDCDIAGTVDFIFGDAAVVFQNCKIMPRQPLPNQANTITAQGKKDPNEDTGISIQSCTITPYDAVTRPTFLGRPWKNYSTTVIMKSEIGAVVDPAGWLAWLPGVVPPDTINYAEYENTGPGSNVAGRVTWTGFRPSIGPDEAAKYTVGSFIDGSEWISAAGVQVEPNV